MDSLTYKIPKIPSAPKAIIKGKSLVELLDEKAIRYLARNIEIIDSQVDIDKFKTHALSGLEELSLINRGRHIGDALHETLPYDFEENVSLLLKTLTPIHKDTKDLGLSGFFYLPHTSYIAQYGRSDKYNNGRDPFDAALAAQYEITQRFTAEFSIRYFIRDNQTRTLNKLKSWLEDNNPHVRRLCSEGTRPRLPWGIRLQDIDSDPSSVLPILEALKNDPELYVRRSVANHLGDISKANPSLVFNLCENWVEGANKELKWLIRHAVRYHAKKGNVRALSIRHKAK